MFCAGMEHDRTHTGRSSTVTKNRTQKRRDEISVMVAARGEVSVEEIAARFGTSHETIRRDLTVLQDRGALLKVHGGAKRVPHAVEGSFGERMEENREAKHVIADKLAAWLAPNQLIFMDTGSTTLIAAKALANVPGLQVVTNSLKIANALASASGGPEVFLLGGRLEQDNCETVGPVTIEEIGRYNAQSAIITIGALCAELGASDYNIDECQVARAMIARARQAVILSDQSKFNNRAAFQVCPLSEIDVMISDTAPDATMASALSAAGVCIL